MKPAQERNPGQAAPGMLPQKPGGAQGAGFESWAEAVETFRALAGSGAAAPQEKTGRAQAGAASHRLQYHDHEREIAGWAPAQPVEKAAGPCKGGGEVRPAVDNLHPTSFLTAAALALGPSLHICCAVRY